MKESIESYEYDYEALIQRISKVLGKESYLSFAKRAGMSDTAFKRYILRGSVPPVNKAWQIAKAGVEGQANEDAIRQLASWIAFGYGNPDQSETNPAQQSQINGMEDIVIVGSEVIFEKAGCTYDDELANQLPFSKKWLIENSLQNSELALIRMIGDSMYSSISSRDTALVEILPDNALQKNLIDDVYVIHINKQLQIKRIQRTRSGYLIKSDNSRYDVYTLHDDEIPDDFKVIARWTGKKF
jgi:phage repressor protein C with HTH and peptisase S24 domain